MITMSIANFILYLTLVAFMCYYYGKGNIKIVRNVKMTDEQFEEIKELEKKRIDLETRIETIQNYQDPEFLD